MNENLIETQYDVTKKSRFLNFYQKNKILIFSSIFLFLIILFSIFFYLDNKEKYKLELADNYIQAEIYLGKNKISEARNLLEKNIYANDSTYSPLSLFLLTDDNLVENKDELLNLYDHVLENNKFENEIKNLIFLKKLIIQSDFSKEEEILNTARIIISSNSLWKSHALLLLGDYFAFKKEYIKAKEFYGQILSLKNLDMKMHDKAKLKLALISNE